MNAFHPAMFAGSTFWQPAGEAMLEFLVSGSAVALIFMLIRRVIARLPATIRYTATSTAMAALVGLAGYHIWEYWPVSSSPDAAATSGASPSAPPGPCAVSPPAVSAAAVTPPAAASTPTGRFTWEAMKPRLVLALPGLWLIGAPLTALFVGLGWTGAARLRRQSTPLLDETLLARFARCQALMQVKDVGLAVCERIAAPIVVGVFKPMILLPPALLTSLSCEQWEMILLHELAHVRRLDNLVNLLQRAVETVLFFHPAVWWALRWMRLEREHCCDAIVLRLGTSPQSYAETLAVLALPGIAPQLATAAMANHELLTRMRHILGTEDLPMTVSWKKLGLAAVMFAVVGGLIASDWSSSSQQAAADESRQKELEEAILRRVLIDLSGEGPEFVDFVRTRQQGDREESLQAVINQIERLKGESGFESSAEDRRALAFADQLVARLQRLQRGEEAGTRSRYGTFSAIATEPSSKSSWAPKRMLGPPDVKEHSDNMNAWAARHPDQGMEWVRLGYQRPIKAAAILIYESFNPGAVTSVRILGPGVSGESIVWEAKGGPNPIQTKNVLTIPIKDPSKTPISAVNIHIDEKRTPGWNEIDAVGLLDAETGETHWAMTADASSTYASVFEKPQYGAQLSIDSQINSAWAASKATGPPDAPGSGDHPNAWAALEADKREEWLQVDFGGEYCAAAILIHENFNPGAIDHVQFEYAGANSADLKVDSTNASKSGRQVTLVRPQNSAKVRSVRIFIDEPRVPGWNEIDAVGLIDAETGETHWAKTATASSSYADQPQVHDQFTFTNTPINQVTDPSWHPRQATGAPNVSEAGDDGRAWASSSQDGQKETLDLTFNPPVQSNLLLVYESFNPGALTEVSVQSEGVQLQGYGSVAGYTITGLKGGWRSIWTGRDPIQPVAGKGVAAIPIPAGVGKMSKVRLTLDSVAVSGWNEIDAVGLLNSETGQVQWASDAKASSWFGEHGTFGTIRGYGEVDVPTRTTAPLYIDVPDVDVPLGISVGAGDWESSTSSWHPSQATGAPNVREASDNPKAWASATPDGQQEWLELTYNPPVLASSISIYESYNPGAITEVQIEEVDPIADALPAGKDGFRTLSKGNQLYKQMRNGLGITTVAVKTNIRPIRRVRLLIDSPAHQGWNEIDAVGLLSTTGELHWAKEAKASSWFGESGAMGGGSRSSIDIDVNVTPPLPAADPQSAKELKIDLNVEGVLSIAGEELTIEELKERLETHQNATSGSVVVVADHSCPFRKVQEVINTCRRTFPDVRLTAINVPPDRPIKKNERLEDMVPWPKNLPKKKSNSRENQSSKPAQNRWEVSLEGDQVETVIEVGTQLMVNSKSPIRSVDGHDPQVLSVDATTSTQLTIEGLQPGLDGFTVTDETNKETDVRVRVVPKTETSQKNNGQKPSLEDRFKQEHALARLVEQYNDQWDKRQFAAAYATALQANRVAPAEQVVTLMLTKSRTTVQLVSSNGQEGALLAVVVDVDRAGALSVDGVSLAEDSVTAFLHGFSSRTPIQLKVARECPHGVVTKLLERCEKAGARNVQLKPGDDGAVDAGPQVAVPDFPMILGLTY